MSVYSNFIKSIPGNIQSNIVFSVVNLRTKMVSCEVKQEEKWEELQKFLCFLVIVFDLMIIQDCSWRVSSSHLCSLLFSQQKKKTICFLSMLLH